MTTEEKIFKIISIIFHPLIIPTYGMIFIIMAIPYFRIAILFKGLLYLFYIISFFIMTCLLPFLTLLYIRKKQLIPMYDIDEKKQRLYPLLITIAYYVVYFLFFAIKLADPATMIMLLIPIVAMILAFILTFFIKVCFHSIAMGSVIGLLFIIPTLRAYIYIVIALLIAGSVCCSSLILKRHNISQIIIGFLLGIVSSSVILLI